MQSPQARRWQPDLENESARPSPDLRNFAADRLPARGISYPSAFRKPFEEEIRHGLDLLQLHEFSRGMGLLDRARAHYDAGQSGIGEDPGLGGEFEIQDPRGVAPAMYAPRLAINAPGGLAMGSSETIPPKAGRILMFPSWLSHAVRPYTGTRQRISIAFNLSV